MKKMLMATVLIHFWADSPLTDVLRGLRAAVDAGH